MRKWILWTNLLLVLLLLSCKELPKIRDSLGSGQYELVRLQFQEKWVMEETSSWNWFVVVGGGSSMKSEKLYSKIRFVLKLTDGQMFVMTVPLGRVTVKYGDQPSVKLVLKDRGDEITMSRFNQVTPETHPAVLIEKITSYYILTVPEHSAMDFLRLIN